MISTGNVTADSVLAIALVMSLTYCAIGIVVEFVKVFMNYRKGG